MSTGYSVPHIGDIDSRIEAIREAIGLVNSFYREFQDICRAMARTPATSGISSAYMNAVFPLPGENEEERFEAVMKRRERVGQLALTGVGSDLNPGTLWSLYNGTTELVDHATRFRKRDAHLNRVWFGDGAALKSRAFDVARALVN